MISELFPLTEKLCDEREKSLRILEDQLKKSSRLFNKKMKVSIRHLIVAGAEELVREFSDDLGIYFINKYKEDCLDSDSDFLDEFLDEILDEDDLNLDDFPGPKRKSKKTQKDIHNENVNSEAKGIYRKLALKYHPDKELDEDKKDEKSEIFQKVNDAYKKNDLYELMKLDASLTVGCIDSDEKIKIYTKELNSKIRSLEKEFFEMKNIGPLSPFHIGFYAKTRLGISAKILREGQKLKDAIKEEKELQKIFLDAKALKDYINEQEEIIESEVDEFDMEMVDFAQAMLERILFCDKPAQKNKSTKKNKQKNAKRRNI